MGTHEAPRTADPFGILGLKTLAVRPCDSAHNTSHNGDLRKYRDWVERVG